MTYAALCEHVAFESCRVGGPPIRPNKRVDSSSGIIDYVEFYCPHGRKHPEQAASVPKNPRSKRASRQNEERTILFCDCKFSFRVRRDPTVVPVVDAEEPKGVSVQRDAKDSKQDSSTVYGWYVDSTERQQAEGRYKKNSHCWVHSGHIKRSQRIADVTQDMREFISKHAGHNISIASISSMIFSEYRVFLSDTQIRWELTKMWAMWQCELFEVACEYHVTSRL